MPNLVYRAVESAIDFRDSGGVVVLTLNNLAFGAGRVSARYDRGAGSRARLHEVRGVFQAASGGFSIGDPIELWLFQSDGTYADGLVGSADASLATNARRNGIFIGNVLADTAVAGTDIVASFQDVVITSRYYSIGVWNGAASRNLNNVANSCRVIVTPMPDEIQ
jgi:hypothetical protein